MVPNATIAGDGQKQLEQGECLGVANYYAQLGLSDKEVVQSKSCSLYKKSIT